LPSSVLISFGPGSCVFWASGLGVDEFAASAVSLSFEWADRIHAKLPVDTVRRIKDGCSKKGVTMIEARL